MFFASSKSRERAHIGNIGVSRTCDHFQIKINMLNPSQEPRASSKAPNWDLEDIDVLCTSKIKIKSKNFRNWYVKDQIPHPNHYQDAKPQSGTPKPHQSTESGLKGHGCSLHLQNQDRDPKFGIWVYQRQVTISKSISGCQTPVRNLQRPPKPQMRT